MKLLPFIPKEYRLNQYNFKIKYLKPDLILSLSEKVTEEFNHFKKVLLNKMENELLKDPKVKRFDYSKISFEWLEVEYKKEDFLAQEVIAEDEDEIIIDLAILGSYREKIPVLNNEDEEDEVFHPISIEKESNIWNTSGTTVLT